MQVTKCALSQTGPTKPIQQFSLDTRHYLQYESNSNGVFIPAYGGKMQHQVRSLVLFLSLLTVLLGTAPGLFAQVDRGAIVGTVVDASAGRVAGAKITVTNLETNQSLELATDAEGNYSAPLLKIGRYSVRAEKPGFRNSIEPGVDVGVNKVLRVDLSMK